MVFVDKRIDIFVDEVDGLFFTQSDESLWIEDILQLLFAEMESFVVLDEFE